MPAPSRSAPNRRRVVSTLAVRSRPAAVRDRSADPPGRPGRVLVLGDLMVDIAIAPDAPLKVGTDVPGRIAIRQGGSAANTARWLGRLGSRATLICAVGRDPAGRILIDALRGGGIAVRATRVAGVATGRIGVLVRPDGERSFVADRGAADRLRPADLRPAWFAGADLLHLPAYSIFSEPLASAAREATRLARAAGALVSLDLSSSGPLLARGRETAAELIAALRPDLVFATAAEATALLDRRRLEGLTDLAALAVVKRGAEGAAVLHRTESGSVLRFEVATQRVAVADTTGAGDAFDAGFLAAWLAVPADRRSNPAVLRRAALAGHRAAARELTGTRPDLWRA